MDKATEDSIYVHSQSSPLVLDAPNQRTILSKLSFQNRTVCASSHIQHRKQQLLVFDFGLVFWLHPTTSHSLTGSSFHAVPIYMWTSFSFFKRRYFLSSELLFRFTLKMRYPTRVKFTRSFPFKAAVIDNTAMHACTHGTHPPKIGPWVWILIFAVVVSQARGMSIDSNYAERRRRPGLNNKMLLHRQFIGCFQDCIKRDGEASDGLDKILSEWGLKDAIMRKTGAFNWESIFRKICLHDAFDMNSINI